ncbi:hypothetical protein [Amycolatopsis sp. cmx-4-61]|uniref:hypothetical protein n=1 Tax=Amycolatopsis sp. cmx-4-61 TaxID=2790937 RepID=UPI00397A67B5
MLGAIAGRTEALLLAVAAGRCGISGGSEPDLFVDNLPFCDQYTAHAVCHAGLVHAVERVSIDRRTRAELTAEGRAVLASLPGA